MFKDYNSKMSFMHLSFSFEPSGGVLFFVVQWKSKTRAVIFQEALICLIGSFSSAETEAYVTSFNPLFSFTIMQQ